MLACVLHVKQTLVYVQAPMLISPSDCTYRSGSMSTGQTGRLHHAMNAGFRSAKSCARISPSHEIEGQTLDSQLLVNLGVGWAVD